MLKKLRIKFVVINMLLLITVLLALFAGVFFLMYTSEKQQAIAIMENTAQNDGRPEKDRQPPDDQPDDFSSPPDAGSEQASPGGFKENSMFSGFSVKLDQNGSVIEVVSQLDLSLYESLAENAAAAALAENTNEGTLVVGDFSLRFLKMEKSYGSILVFYDRSSELSTLYNLAFVSLMIGGGSILLLFFISLFLSSWAIKPVKKTWEQQKQFMADASHELKTPLTVIQTNADAMLSNPSDTVEQQSKWLYYIKAEAGRMSKLVNNLLFLAKLDSQSQGESPGTVLNMSIAVTSVILPFESVIFEEGKSFSMQIEPDIYICGHQDRIKQLAVILMDNAVKHAGEGGRIEILLAKDTAKNRVRLVVTNTGPGIPPEHLDKIFERFYRADQSRVHDRGGYGLGLPIAKAVVKQHGGTIRVQSEENGETRFIVELPFLPNQKPIDSEYMNRSST